VMIITSSAVIRNDSSIGMVVFEGMALRAIFIPLMSSDFEQVIFICANLLSAKKACIINILILLVVIVGGVDLFKSAVLPVNSTDFIKTLYDHKVMTDC